MAFGITRSEMKRWKEQVQRGEIAYLTHYWLEPRFPGIRTVTKVGCSDIAKLSDWCIGYGLDPRYIHHRQHYPHFDLIGSRQREILLLERQLEQMERFGI
ncbi:hypothetical protein [Paenibacillus sp. 1P07SE]|uniref:hypothetical protein n=1 Tax=Paenibacillus sp. 1P07SE TaxID=3132209 RepID=UPI0039A5FD98